MAHVSIDLGTTNIKVALFSDSLTQLDIVSENVEYQRNNGFIEFDPDTYSNIVFSLLRKVAKYYDSNIAKKERIRTITLTGQAESLIVLGDDGKPIRNGISWLDMRSSKECEEMLGVFGKTKTFQVTGQPSIIPTWPITKMLWINRNEKEIFNKASKYLMLKDYIQYRLTGIMAGDFSIYNFTCYLNVREKKYWTEILDYCGIKTTQLPDIHEPCTITGRLMPETARDLGYEPETMVNIGTLDHFAGMVGTGNIEEGIISESTGTVLSVATLIKNPSFTDENTPCHYGFIPNTFVLLPVCESGGISLEWFKNAFVPNDSFKEMDSKIIENNKKSNLIFLPYITGVNAPDFDMNLMGTFYGIQLDNDRYDFALAVMEGVGYMLKRNIDHLRKSGIVTKSIISTGGGAKSKLWSKVKADICGLKILVPENQEAASLGAAAIGAVSAGCYKDLTNAVNATVKIKQEILPSSDKDQIIGVQYKYAQFCRLIEALEPIYSTEKERHN